MTAQADRVHPHNLEAEKALLGALLLDGSRLEDVRPLVEPEAFYRAAHQKIFRTVVRLAERDEIVDFLTVKAQLAAAGDLESAGGPAYLASLTDGVPTGMHVEAYARIVHEQARLRAIIETADRMLADAFLADEPAEAVIDRAEQRLFTLKTGQDTEGLVPLARIIPGVIGQIEAWHQRPGAVTGLASGFFELDAMTRGFHPGTLVIVAARPGMGKSAFVLNVAQFAAAAGHVVAFFSLEMSSQELALRSLAGEAGIDGHRLQRGRIWESEWGRLSQAFGALSERSLYIDESPFVTVFDIKARARRLKTQQRLDLVIVDYTQLMVGHERHQNRTLEIAAITRGLKALAKDLKVPVIALSQLNRDLEKRDNKRPMLADLRDSGALEQDADLVLLLYRDDVYHPEDSKEPGIAEIIIAKHRQGPIGTIKLGWNAEYTQFANHHDEPAPVDQRLPIGDR